MTRREEPQAVDEGADGVFSRLEKPAEQSRGQLLIVDRRIEQAAQSLPGGGGGEDVFEPVEPSEERLTGDAESFGELAKAFAGGTALTERTRGDDRGSQIYPQPHEQAGWRQGATATALPRAAQTQALAVALREFLGTPPGFPGIRRRVQPTAAKQAAPLPAFPGELNVEFKEGIEQRDLAD